MKKITLLLFTIISLPIFAQGNKSTDRLIIDCDTIYPNKHYEIQLTLLDAREGESKAMFKLIDKKTEVQLFCDSLVSSVAEFYFEDFNNDNIKDVLIQSSTDVRENWTWHLYLVDTAQNKLTKVDGFEEIKNPTYNAKYNVIENYAVSGTDWTSFYTILNNTVFDFGYTIYWDEENPQEKYDKALEQIRNFSIVAVSRKTDSGVEFVYITSQGRVIDSVRPYFFDNGTDAEHNGFIRFRDKHSEQVGLLNRRGEIVIPATYSYLSPVSNGFLTALIGADTVRDGEYSLFVGGEKLLLDTTGVVHIKNFTPKGDQLVDLYSVKQISSPADLDTTRMNFLATNGNYYSFENYETAFAEWLDQNLLSDFTPERFKTVLYPQIRISIDYGELQCLSPDQLVRLYYENLYKTLIRMKDPGCEYFYAHTSFYPGYGNSREPYNTDRHPMVELVVTSENGIQEHFNFYRTDNGYRLIEATLRNSGQNAATEDPVVDNEIISLVSEAEWNGVKSKLYDQDGGYTKIQEYTFPHASMIQVYDILKKIDANLKDTLPSGDCKYTLEEGCIEVNYRYKTTDSLLIELQYPGGVTAIEIIKGSDSTFSKITHSAD